MYKELVFVCCAIALISVSTTEAKGGRGGGGRSSGRSSSGRSSSGRGGGFFSSSSGSKSSSGRGGLFSSSSSGSGKSSIIGGKSGSGFSGGWFHGFFHSTPYRYTYRPTHIVHSSSTNTGSYHIPTKEEEEAEQNKETSDYAVGYSISKALGSDFFSIFNVVHDISKYPEKIRNKELLTTTTQSPVSTYDLNHIVNPTTPYGVDPKSYFLDDDTLFGIMNSQKPLENNAGIPSSIGNFENIFEVTSTESPTTKVDASIVGNFDNDFEVTSTESTTAKDNTKSYYPDEGIYTLFGGMNFNRNNLFNDNIQQQLAEIQSSVAKIGSGWDEKESTTMKTSLDFTNESLNEMLKRMEDSYGSLNRY